MTNTGVVTLGWIDLVCDSCADGVNSGIWAKVICENNIPDIAANPKVNALKLITLLFLPNLDIPKAKEYYFIKFIQFHHRMLIKYVGFAILQINFMPYISDCGPPVISFFINPFPLQVNKL